MYILTVNWIFFPTITNIVRIDTLYSFPILVYSGCSKKYCSNGGACPVVTCSSHHHEKHTGTEWNNAQ